MASQITERQQLLAAQKAHADQQKLDKLARTNPCVKELIEEVEKLREKVKTIKK